MTNSICDERILNVRIKSDLKHILTHLLETGETIITAPKMAHELFDERGPYTQENPSKVERLATDLLFDTWGGDIPEDYELNPTDWFNLTRGEQIYISELSTEELEKAIRWMKPEEVLKFSNYCRQIGEQLTREANALARFIKSRN